MLYTVIRMAVMWMAMSYFKGNKAGTPSSKGQSKEPEKYSFPSFTKGSIVDMYCFISEKQHIHRYSDHLADLIWSERGVEVGGSATHNYTYNYEPSSVRHQRRGVGKTLNQSEAFG